MSAVLVIGGFAFAGTASAYTHTGARWSGTQIFFNIDPGFMSAGARAAWTSSLPAWNGRPIDVTLLRATNGVLLSEVDYPSEDYDRIAYWSPGTGQIRTASAFLNYAYTASYPAGVRQGVAVHEIGHTMGLGHASGCVIMVNNTPARRACGISGPQADDVNGINALY